MAPHLHPSIIAAIETAVEVNDSVLKSSYIHSLAKIYKTSPQAVVWNMKRYNKVKANCDDRQKGGRPSVMDKDSAAEATKQILDETPGLRMDKVAEKLFERFGVQVSTTWVSRLMTKYGIVYKIPKPPKIKQMRIPEHTNPLNEPSIAVQSEKGSVTYATPQYRLPPLNPSHPPSYPSFRQDLQHAITTATQPAVEHRPIPVLPQIRHNEGETHGQGPLSGMLKFAWPPPISGASVQRHYQSTTADMSNPEIQYGSAIPSNQSDSSMESEGSPPPPKIQQNSSPPRAKSSEVVWEVLNVVEYG